MQGLCFATACIQWGKRADMLLAVESLEDFPFALSSNTDVTL